MISLIRRHTAALAILAAAVCAAPTAVIAQDASKAAPAAEEKQPEAAAPVWQALVSAGARPAGYDAEPERYPDRPVWRIRFWQADNTYETHVVSSDAEWLTSY